MINKLSIRNFKSIRELDLDCRRVNVFIGEPNAGKTNILEGLGLWCRQSSWHLFNVCRIQKPSDIFFQHHDLEDASVSLDDARLIIFKGSNPKALILDMFLSGADEERPTQTLELELQKAEYKTTYNPEPDADALKHLKQMFLVLYFLFRSDTSTDIADPRIEGLAPPFGQNLGNLLSANRDARLLASSFFSGQQYSLTVDRSTETVSMSRSEDGIVSTLPYNSMSETIRRMAFYHLAIATHKNQVLVFDEPEAHSFPPYTKTLAERIALDDRGNQFFLTTHSPYMLDSLLSKTPAAELNVVLCRMENFETKAYQLNQEQIDQIKEWSMDAFFNFDRLLPEIP